MAETTHHTLMLPETDAGSLREALHSQQQIMQKLYRELDDEREAAASATSEAMSMILRLQGEKAELKMEANQYKRMAEEKMCHAEEALALCEDIMYQKEMEIASLEFQIQSYRKKLISLGVSDATVSEQGNLRRLNSLPHHVAEMNSKKVEFQVEINNNHDLERKSGGADINSYWEKIRRLDGRIKEISEGRSKDLGKNKSAIWKGGTWSHLLYSQLTDDLHLQKSCESREIGTGNEQVKTVLPPHCSSSAKKKAPKDAPVIIDHGLPPPAPTAAHSSVSPGDYQNLMQRIERLERARGNVGQQAEEENIVPSGEEEMHLLKAIQEQLSGIQTELRSRKAHRRPVVRDEPCLDILQEAMLYFWL